MKKIATQQIGMSLLDKERIRSDGLDKLARFLLITQKLNIYLLYINYILLFFNNYIM